jgi:hypothetical protein
MYLLDTVVLSELRKPPRQRNRNLVHWIGVPSQDLFVSVPHHWRNRARRRTATAAKPERDRPCHLGDSARTWPDRGNPKRVRFRADGCTSLQSF